MNNIIVDLMEVMHQGDSDFILVESHCKRIDTDRIEGEDYIEKEAPLKGELNSMDNCIWWWDKGGIRLYNGLEIIFRSIDLIRYIEENQEMWMSSNEI